MLPEPGGSVKEFVASGSGFFSKPLVIVLQMSESVSTNTASDFTLGNLLLQRLLAVSQFHDAVTDEVLYGRVFQGRAPCLPFLYRHM